MKKIVENNSQQQNADFAKFANSAINNQSKKIDPVESEESNENYDDEKYLTNTPIIPQSVYANLPAILKKGAEAFKDAREKDTFLTGALTVLSGCMPHVTGTYSGRTVYPHLFCFIIAPAASGKGALQSSKELADLYHSEVLKKSEEEKKEYQKKLQAMKRAKQSEEEEATSIQALPKEPPFKVIFIPADSSTAKIIQHLQWNDGKGIICETEADTLGIAFNSDWSSYSHLLRKAFHHEKISVSRKTENEYLEINTPQLAVALSGTPKQVFNIISSSEDGLFSRFMFYVFQTDCKWIDPSPYGNQINLTEYFQKLAIEVNDMVLFLNKGKTTILLSKEQWDQFNPLFEKYLHQISTFVSDNALSVVKRLGLIAYRFCMILTTLRKFETQDTANQMQCLDTDFESALALTEIYLQHSIVMFNNLPKQNEQGPFKSGDNKKQFFDALPKQFTRKEAIQLGSTFSIQERSVGSLLKNCLGTYLLQPKYGFYEKCN